MIRSVYAEGFRSLDKFSIDVRSGLNVLVGPNGGGKTNILALFSFISAVASNDLGEAINASGGASKVFRKVGKASFVKDLLICVSGEFTLDRAAYLPTSYRQRLLEYGTIGLAYEWMFRIDSSLGYDEAFFSQQTLKCRLITKSLFPSRDDSWDFELEARSSTPQEISLEERISNSEVAEVMTPRGRIEPSSNIIISDREDYTNSSLPLFYLTSSYVLRYIATDLEGGVTFNFDPAICKTPNDSAQSPTLERNGNGLAATIYAIQKSSATPVHPRAYYPSRMFDSSTAKSLQQYFRLVNPGVGSVGAQNNPFDNKIVVQFSIINNNGSVDFPLDLASDGTVKWLAFIVALLTQKSGFSVEEPENFLHPDIQRQAIELVRTETEGAEHVHVLMTTHSETLLNATRPEELIIVSMEDGVTSAKRLDDPSLIDEEIVETGFGLGYYYISGALND